MNRTKKNILSVIVTLLLTACIGFTVYQIKSQNTPPAAPTGQMQQQQSGGNSGSSTDKSSSADDNIIKGNNSNSNNSPNNSNNSNQQTPPEKPSGSDSNSGSTSQQNNHPKVPSTKIATKYIVLLGAETFFWVLSILYLIFTGFHKRSFKEAFASWKKFTICGLASIILTCGLTFGETYLIKQLSTPAQMQQPGNNSGNGPGSAPSGNQPGNGSGSSNSDNDSASAKATASKTVSKSSKTLSGSYTSKKSDQSVVLVKNGGTLTLNNAVLNKLSGDSSNTENSEFYPLYKRNWISCDLLYR